MPIDDPNVLLNDPDMSRDFLSDMLGTGEKKEKPPPDGKYLEGQPVVVDGLKGRPELNGRCGSVVGFDAAKGRYIVIVGEEQLSLKSSNLVAAAAESKVENSGPLV